MIHRDFCNPAYTKEYSPLRMQFHFLLSRYVCWDGFIPLTRRELAEALACDVQIIHKFIKKGVREGILSCEGDRLYLLKRVSEYTEGYVRHYPFLESEAFRRLSLHAQRLVLYFLWYGVHKGRTLKRDITSFYHATPERKGVLNLYAKSGIYMIIEEAAEFFTIERIHQKGKEMLRVTGLKAAYAGEEALDNLGDWKLLRDQLEAHFCDEHVSHNSRIELLKLKKHCIKKFRCVGQELFNHALSRLLSLHKLFELDQRGEIGIYFKSILKDLEQKIVPTLRERIDNTRKAMKSLTYLSLEKAGTWIQKFRDQMAGLNRDLDQILSPQEKGRGSDQASSSARDHEVNPVEQIEFTFYNWLENS